MNEKETVLEKALEQVVDTMDVLRDISEGTAPVEVYSAMEKEGFYVVTDVDVMGLAEAINTVGNKGIMIGVAGTLVGLGAIKWLTKIL